MCFPPPNTVRPQPLGTCHATHASTWRGKGRDKEVGRGVQAGPMQN